MTADIINLRREKRKRERAAKAAQAAANRARFGRTKGQKMEEEHKVLSFQRALDGRKLVGAAEEDAASESGV